MSDWEKLKPAVSEESIELARKLFNNSFKMEFALDLAIEAMNHARKNFAVDNYFIATLESVERKRAECK